MPRTGAPAPSDRRRSSGWLAGFRDARELAAVVVETPGELLTRSQLARQIRALSPDAGARAPKDRTP